MSHPFYTVNPVTGVKRLPDAIHQRLLGRLPREVKADESPIIEYMLDEAGLLDTVDSTPEVDFPLPKWLGTIADFEQDLINDYSRVDSALNKLQQLVPQKPRRLDIRPGWSTYLNRQWLATEPPNKSCMVIDFETVKVSDDDWRPIVAVVLTNDARWYVWTADPTTPLEQLDKVVPVGRKNIYVGHNIGYDLALIAEESQHQPSGSLALCTMGMHILTRGVSNQQRSLLNIDPMDYDEVLPAWLADTSKSSLDAVYELHFNRKLDKGVRDIIISDGWHWCRDNLDKVVKYCLDDVLATQEVFTAVYPEFTDHVPDRVMRYGMMHQYTMYVPLSRDRWYGFYDRAEKCYQVTLDDVGQRIIEAARVVLAHLGAKLEWVEDRTDVTDSNAVYRFKTVKQRKSKKCPNPQSITTRYRLTWVDGYEPSELDLIRYHQLDWTLLGSKKYGVVPTWLASLLDNPTAGRSVSTLVLGVTWLGSPVRWVENEQWSSNGQPHGWCFRNADGSVEQVPSPEKAGKPVCSMFIKGFMKDEDTITEALKTADGINDELLMQVMSCSLWRSFRKRVSQIRVTAQDGYPVTKPVISRTVSGRCVDLWQLMPNPKRVRLGSGIRALVEAPSGYRLVKADLASQELRAASNLGDAHFGFYGATPLGKSNLVGSSKMKTDPHSLLGALTGILNRTLCKNINYGTIYGLSVKGIADYIQKANPATSRQEAQRLARLIDSKLKGIVSQVSGLYLGGMASDTFNVITKCYRSPRPMTPYGKFRMSKALTAAGWKNYQPTFQNWVVQSTGSVITTKLLAYTMYLFKRFSIPARLVLTVHDEFCYLVRVELAESVGYVMQLAHLLLSADITEQLGLDCLPANYSFFDGIEIDTIFRKSPNDQPVTPDDPDAYIEPGRELTVQDSAEAGRLLLKA